MRKIFKNTDENRARTSDHHDLIAQRLAAREDASQSKVASQQEKQARFARMLGSGRSQKIQNSRNNVHADERRRPLRGTDRDAAGDAQVKAKE